MPQATDVPSRPTFWQLVLHSNGCWAFFICAPLVVFAVVMIIVDQRERTEGYIFLLVTGIGLLIGVRAVLRVRYLATHGQMVRADSVRWEMGTQGARDLLVRYTINGREFSNRSTIMDRDVLGQEVVVHMLVDPRYPRRSVIARIKRA